MNEQKLRAAAIRHAMKIRKLVQPHVPIYYRSIFDSEWFKLETVLIETFQAGAVAAERDRSEERQMGLHATTGVLTP